MRNLLLTFLLVSGITILMNDVVFAQRPSPIKLPPNKQKTIIKPANTTHPNQMSVINVLDAPNFRKPPIRFAAFPLMNPKTGKPINPEAILKITMHD